MDEYRCLACGHTFPARVPMEEAECPRCGGRALDSNPWLLRSPSAEGLSPEDYAGLAQVGN